MAAGQKVRSCEPNGPDVYANVKIDYRSHDVTSANFLSVLKGDAGALKGVGSGRVLSSGKDDDVFVYIQGCRFG
eukprot:gene48924-biopygen18140